MTEEAMELAPDEPPKNGEWVDADEVTATSTKEERAEGRRLGEAGYDSDLDDPDDETTGFEGEDDDAEGDIAVDVEPEDE